MIIWNSGKEELGRKLKRRRRRKAEKKTRKPNTQNCQPDNTAATWKGGRIRRPLSLSFSLIRPGLSPHPVVLASSCQQSSPQICGPALAFWINDNSTQVSWCPVAPNDLMRGEDEALTQQQGKKALRFFARTPFCLSSGGSVQFLYQI